MPSGLSQDREEMSVDLGRVRADAGNNEKLVQSVQDIK